MRGGARRQTMHDAPQGSRDRVAPRAGLIGTWLIAEIDLWDLKDVELLGPAFIEFTTDRRGRFRFVAVEGWTDCRHQVVEGRPHVDFTWEGFDEGDQVSGRGWARLEPDGSLRGHLYFHRGDDSAFRAVRAIKR